MLELIRKDVGLCRNVLLGGLIALLAPYAWVLSEILDNTFNTPGWTYEEAIELFCLRAIWASLLSVYFSIVHIAFLAGFIVAGERRDRSAEFLAFLPPAKWMVISSKAIVCLGWAALVAILYFLFTELIVPWVSDGEYSYRQSGGMSLAVPAYALTVFGGAWLLSCCIESPIFSIIAGLLAPFLIVSTLYLVGRWIGSVDIGLSTNWVFTIIGFASFFGGVWHFTSRVEP